MSFYTVRTGGNFGVMDDTITLKEALEIMNQVDKKGDPLPFSIEAVTCDLHRKKGGYRLIYQRAIQCNAKGGRVQTFFNDHNNVRNIKGVGTNEIRSVHPILIVKLNGKTVTL